MTFEPITIKTCLAPKNDSLSLSLMKDIYRISANTFPLNYCFLKVENVEIFIYFPHYGNFLLHKLNSYKNYLRGETIEGGKLFKGANYLRKHGM